jgi:hypothetical protein
MSQIGSQRYSTSRRFSRFGYVSIFREGTQSGKRLSGRNNKLEEEYKVKGLPWSPIPVQKSAKQDGHYWLLLRPGGMQLSGSS